MAEALESTEQIFLNNKSQFEGKNKTGINGGLRPFDGLR
jgi:hypothetical protein